MANSMITAPKGFFATGVSCGIKQPVIRFFLNSFILPNLFDK